MRTAILLSGHMRTFARCLPTLHWHVFRHFPGADFIVSTVADADASSAQLLVPRYGFDRVHYAAVPEQPDCVAAIRAAGAVLPDTRTPGQCYTHEPYPISVHPQAVLRQLWQLGHAWRTYRTHFSPGSHDLIIRCRPDLWFHSCARPGPAIHLEPTDALLPWWGKFGGINDRFAWLGERAAEAYFTTYERVPALLDAGCPLHPESLLKASLLAAGCQPASRLAAEFGTLRQSGELRAAEISTVDLAHVALR